MSKQRYDWWQFALSLIREYPVRAMEYENLHEQKITVATSGQPGGGGEHRPVEQIVLKQLPPTEQRAYDAVRRAVAYTKHLADGKIRLQTIRLTVIQNRKNIHGAAELLHISERSARRYRYQFILLVGYEYGFLSKEAYTTAVKRDYGN